MKKSLGILLALMLSTPAHAGRNKPTTMPFDVLIGMPVITVQTSMGEKRFVLDTGSNISSMDIKGEKELTLRVAGKQFPVQFRPTQTKVFYQFEALLPRNQHVDGILGSDFMQHFHHVTFDFNNCWVSFQ